MIALNPGRALRIAVRRSIDCLRDPALAAEMLRKTKRRLSSDPRREAAERRRATAWCRACAREPERALSLVSPGPSALQSVRDRYSEVWAAAEERVAGCPVRVGGAGNVDLLYSLAESLRARTVIETGVAMGWSTLALLLSLQHRAGARLISIDLPYLLRVNDEWVGCAVPQALRQAWTLDRTSDREGLPRALKEAAPIDLAHYDSDKSYEGRVWGYERLWHGLRPGGVLVSDDPDENFAFRDFCERVGEEPIIIEDRAGDKHQGLLVKPAA